MNRLPMVAVLASSLAACVPPSNQPMTAAHAAAIRDSVQVTLDAFRRYSAAGQWDSLGALYAPESEFRWLEQGMVQYRKASEIREALRRVPRTSRIETTYNDTEIVPLAPGVAVVATAFYTRLLEPGRSTSVEFGGVLDMTLVHREAGWRILLGHSSSRAR